MEKRALNDEEAVNTESCEMERKKQLIKKC